MKPCRPTLALLLQRLLLSLLLVTALLAHGAPSGMAAMPVSAAMLAGDDGRLPCHETGSAREMPAPEKAKAEPFACCATLACGMMFQALPTDFQPEIPTIANAFARPMGRMLPDPPEPNTAWRPPAFLL